MKKLVSLLVISLLLFSLCVACTPAEAPEAKEEATKESAESKSAEPVELTIAIWGNEDRQATFEELFTAFEEQNNCSVTVNLVAYADYATKLATQLAAGNAPDVVWLADGMEAQFMQSGNLLDIASYVVDDADYAFEDLIYCNNTLFKEAGVKTPAEYVAEGNWTYETMYDLASQMTDLDNGKYGLKLWDTSSVSNYVYAFYDLILAYGADYFNTDTSKFTLNTPEGIAAIQAIHDLIYKDESHLKPGDATEFTAGTIAMARSTFSYAKTIKGADLDFEWEMVSEPKGPDADASVITGFAYYSANADSDNPELAAEMIKFMTNAEMMTSVVGTFVAPRGSVLNSTEFLQQADGIPTEENILEAFVGVIEERGLRSYPAHKNFSLVQDQVTMDFDNWFAGIYKSAEETVAAMETNVNALLAE